MTTRFEVNQLKVTDYSAEEHELAYEIWVLEAARNANQVSRIFEERHKRPITADTIRRWAKEEDWAGRFTADMEHAFPHARKETAGNLVAAGLTFSRQILAHAHGQKIPKDEHKFVLGVIDRAGFSPVGNNDRVATSSPSQIQHSTLIEKLLSPEDIAAIAAEAGILEDEDASDD
jgi:hypothetical protein